MIERTPPRGPSRHLALCLLLALGASLAQDGPVQVQTADAPPRFLVKLKPGAEAARSAAAPFPGFTVVRRLDAVAVSPARRARADDLARWIAVQAAEGSAQAASLAALRRDPRVEHAEVDARVSIVRTPNDPELGRLWGMETIQAPQAWELETGSAQVVVAVIDTGVDYTHPDLSANMWTNPGEVPGNGVDDDRNGVVDDFYGYDFANGDPDPRDDNVHGTHCAGTVGAVGDNGVGVAGVCWSVRIMALKFLGSDGSGNTSDAIACIHYAIANGADVMSNSWGGGESSRALEEAITAARAAGIVFVAAAGNSGDTRVHYPGAYPAALTVSATDRADALATFSSYGPAVDLAAPGVGIVSCALEHGYASLSGTSMATPHVAGLAALIKARNPRLTPDQVELVLTGTADDLGPPGKDVRFGHGRINAAAALRSVSPDATQFPELRITTPTGGQVVNEPLVVEGRAAGASFASYRLDYLPPGGDAFLLLRTSSAAVVDGPLGTLTPQPGWSDGFGAVRLTVTDTAGGTFRTAVGFRYRTTELEAPAPYAEFSGGDPVSIRGTAGGEGFRSYTLDYGAGAAPTAWTPIHSATRAVAGGLLGSWAPPAGLPDGVYTLRLRAEFSAGTRVATTAVVVERARLDGWPRTLSPSAWGFNDTPRVVPLAAGNRLLAGYGPGIGVFLGYVPRDLPFLALKAYDAQGAPVTGFDPAYPVFGSRVGTPAVGDLDRDGTPELAVLAQCTPPTGVEWRVFVLDPDGAIRWSRRVGVGEVGLFEALVALADLDGDGFLDVVCGGGPSAGTLQAFDRRGAPLEGFPVQVPGAKLLPERFAVADLDGDGGLEVAFWVRTQDDGHRLCVYRADGSVYPGVQPELGRFSGIFHPVGPVAGDLDGDGTLDLVAAGWGGSERKVFALRPDGRSLPGWPASDPPGHVTGLSLGDLDGDGKLEVVITNHSGGFQAFEHDGTLSAIRGGAAGEGVRGSSPLLADFDGDGRLDVVYRAVHQVAQPAGAARADPLWVPRIVGYRADGQPLRGFPKQAAQPAIRGASLRSSGGLTLGDLSGDGRLELLVGTSSMAEATTGGRVLGRVVAYATGLRADRRQVAWGTYHGNSHNTGVGAEPPAPTPDTTPPQVAILRPASGGKVFVLARIELEVSDDVLVERVELQVDGVAVATLSEAPFAFDWRPGAREPGPARIRAVAYDPAGNQASAEVEVEVTRLVREVEPTQRAPVRNPKRTPSPMKQPLGGG